MKTTSERMKQRMEHLGLKQADLVEMTGISKGALSSYLSGHYLPKQNNIYLISKALNVNEAWLMGLDVPMERESRGKQYDDATQLKANSNPFADQPEQALRVLNLYNQLDSSDQDKVEGIIEGLLLNEKYISKKK